MNNPVTIRPIGRKLFFFFLLIYLLTAPGHLNVADTLKVYHVTKSIVERGDVDIPELVAPLGSKSAKGKDGRFYTFGAVGLGQSLLMIPLYVLGGPFNIITVSLLSQILSAITCVIIFLFASNIGYSRRTSLIITGIYGLGTIAWPYSKSSFEVAQELMFILCSMFLVYKYSKEEAYHWLVLSGFTMGWAILTRPTSFLALLPLALFLILKRWEWHKFFEATWRLLKDGLVFSLGFLPFMAIMCWYNYYRFGYFIYSVGSIVGRISFVGGGEELIQERVGGTFDNPIFVGLYGLLLSPGKSFFLYTPVALLFFFVLRSFYKKDKPLTISFLVLIITTIFFYSRVSFWSGDCAWGPRYIIFLTPYFILPLGELFEGKGRLIRSQGAKIALIGLFILSFIIQVAAVSIHYQRYFFKINPLLLLNWKTYNQVYADVSYSPIKEQFKYIWKIVPHMSHFTFKGLPSELDDIQKGKLKPSGEDDYTNLRLKALETFPAFNVLDFWYVYSIYLGASKLILLVPFFLFLLVIFIGWKLYRQGFALVVG